MTEPQWAPTPGEWSRVIALYDVVARNEYRSAELESAINTFCDDISGRCELHNLVLALVGYGVLSMQRDQDSTTIHARIRADLEATQAAALEEAKS